MPSINFDANIKLENKTIKNLIASHVFRGTKLFKDVDYIIVNDKGVNYDDGSDCIMNFYYKDGHSESYKYDDIYHGNIDDLSYFSFYTTCYIREISGNIKKYFGVDEAEIKEKHNIDDGGEKLASDFSGVIDTACGPIHISNLYAYYTNY